VAEVARDEGHRRPGISGQGDAGFLRTRWRRSCFARTGTSRQIIAAKEVFPKGAAYMERENMETYRENGELRVRQRPGPKNALGFVKFLFPNDFNIYLHTPEPRSCSSRMCEPLVTAASALKSRPSWPSGCSDGPRTGCSRKWANPPTTSQ